MAEGASNKDVIYIDVDDEITGIIDKVRSSKRQIVALVIPKRSAVLQSIVNMKLLKRTADSAKKNVVLITGDEGLMPLAGNVGIHVARNLQSRPEIPKAPAPLDMKPEVAEEPVTMAGKFADDDEQPLDKSKTLGELSGAAVAGEDAIELDNSLDDDGVESIEQDDGKKGKKDKKTKKNKALQVPNFNRFRTWMIIGGALLVVFIILFVISLSVLPKAAVTINTNSQNVASSLQLNLSNGGGVNTTTETLPAQTEQSQKAYTGTVNTTGQQNNGQKASGTVTLSLTNCSQNSVTIPAGTGITANNLTFITQSSVTLNSVLIGSSCKNSQFQNFSSAAVSVVAQNGGANYNIQPSTFTVPNESNVSGSSSQAFTGGTDDVTQIVAQADITNAQSKINTDSSSIKSQLESDLQSQGLFPITATFTASTPNPTPSTPVGQPAATVTVTESITYTMQGVKRADLQTLVAASVKNQISTTSQRILDYGINNATFSSQGANTVNMQDTALVGFALDQGTIKKQIAGKKPATAEAAIKSYSGVTNVSVHLSPFFVSTIPKNTSKITVNIVNPKS